MAETSAFLLSKMALDSCVALEGYACIEEKEVMFSLQTKRALHLMKTQCQLTCKLHDNSNAFTRRI